ncbi:MAG: WD40 repeat domain-containing protein [Pseudomonadota bacterium]
MSDDGFDRWDVDAPLTGVAVEQSGQFAAFSGGDGCVRVIDLSSQERRLETWSLTEGAIIALAADCHALGFLCGTDDGIVYQVHAEDGPSELARLDRSSWPDQLVTHASGLRAIADGRQVRLLDAEGQQINSLGTHPSTVAGMCFDDPGRRLAVSHYNGVSLWALEELFSEPKRLEHRGSHLSLGWSRDGRYLVTATQENIPHAWDLVSGRDIDLGQSLSKIKSLGWSADGSWLLASGSDTVSAWQFTDGDLPPAAPRMLGRYSEDLVGQVCAHPILALTAAGYNDGSLDLVSLAPRPKRHCLVDSKGSAVTALAWSPDGTQLLGGCSDGHLFAYRFDSDWLAQIARPTEAS